MILPQRQLKNLSSLIIASSTNQEGIMGISSLIKNEKILNNQYKFFTQLNINSDQVVKVIVTTNAKLKIVSFYQSLIRNVEGVITDKKNIFFTILTADCIPLVIYDSKKEVLALIHLGWRAMVRSLVKKSIDLMKKTFNCQPKDFFAYLGPAIGKECYRQTGWKAIIKKIKFQISGNKNFISQQGKYILFDLKRAVFQQLINQGVPKEHIEITPYCTVCQKELFPSYFREGQNRQSSILTVAGMKE